MVIARCVKRIARKGIANQRLSEEERTGEAEVLVIWGMSSSVKERSCVSAHSWRQFLGAKMIAAVEFFFK